jgi:hypothetical protein
MLVRLSDIIGTGMPLIWSAKRARKLNPGDALFEYRLEWLGPGSAINAPNLAKLRLT